VREKVEINFEFASLFFLVSGRIFSAVISERNRVMCCFEVRSDGNYVWKVDVLQSICCELGRVVMIQHEKNIEEIVEMEIIWGFMILLDVEDEGMDWRMED
jgi:hypothetical protein